MHFSTLAAGAVAGLAVVASAIPTIETKGAKFFTSDGDQFYIKGIAYQLTPDDPLLDNAQCQRDAKLMATIGTNTIRVYHVDPLQDHSACMTTFADAGIYLFVDLETFDTSIDQNSPHWNQTQLSAFAKVMDEFQQYDNTAGFFVGNEVLTTGNGSIAAPYVKAAARDMKAYRDSKKYRNIPVGYSAADISTLRPMLQNYMACGSNFSESLDFFSLNAYEWCGTATNYEISGYDMLEKNATNLNIPIFLSETGCIAPRPRTFEDQASVFGVMADVWSGAIIYEWILETNDYGLISYGPHVDPTGTTAPPDGFTRSGTPTPVSPDFANLSNQWKTLSPTGVKASDYTPSLTAPPCPAFTSGVWEVNGDVSLPSLGQTFDAAVASSITAGTAASSSTSKGNAAMPQMTLAPEVKGGVVGLVGVAVGMALL